MIQDERRRTAHLVAQVLEGLSELGRVHDRPFTLDGHAVGSLGEVVAQVLFDLRLEVPSNAGFDATVNGDEPVEIKATFGERVAFRPTSRRIPKLRVLVLKLNPVEPSGLVVFNGMYSTVEDALPPRVGSNGQTQLSLTRLRDLNKVDINKLPETGVSWLAQSSGQRRRYCLIVDADEAEFCCRVNNALGRGYEVHGSPFVTTKRGEECFAQALVWSSETDPPIEP